MAYKNTTRKKLIKAGTEVFGELGFKSATVRKICKHANVPIGSISYHFGDKEGLYSAILEEVFQVSFEKHPLDSGQDTAATHEERLYQHIRTALYRMLGEDGVWADAGKGRLLAQELNNPSPVAGRLDEKFIRPAQQHLFSIIDDFFTPHADEELVKECAQSVIGQVFKRVYPNRGLSVLGPKEKWDTARIEKVARLITTFSLGGLREVKKQLIDITDHRTEECSNECE